MKHAIRLLSLIALLALATTSPVTAEETAPQTKPRLSQAQIDPQTKAEMKALQEKIKVQKEKLKIERDKIKAAREKLQPQIQQLKADTTKLKELRAREFLKQQSQTANQEALVKNKLDAHKGKATTPENETAAPNKQ